MSRVDPVLRFIGVPSRSDELDLLGIDPAYVSKAGIEAALASRLALVYDHPDGRSADADAVRKLLREAADVLLDEGARHAIIAAHSSAVADQIRANPAPEFVSHQPAQTASTHLLTPLQEQLLLVMASCGGWNATSRAQMASVAASNDLAPSELVGMIKELAQAMRSGAQAAPRHNASSASVAARAMEPGFMERVIDQYAPELRQDDARSVVKLCLLFSGIGLLCLVLMARFLFPDLLSTVPSSEVVSVGAEAEVQSETIRGTFENMQSSGANSVPMTPFATPPVLRPRSMPPEVHDAVDASPETVRRLDAFARRLIGVRELDESMQQEWSDLIGTASTAWFLVDPVTSGAMRRSVQRVMESAGANPDMFQPLERAIAPMKPDAIRSPIDVAHGAWEAGMMNLLANAETTSPAARANAVRLLRASLGRDANPIGFDGAAANWLRLSVPGMVQRLEIEPAAVDQWSFWFDSLQALEPVPAVQSALIAGLEQLLQTDTDLSRQGPSQQVLARLLTELDWRTDLSVKRFVLGMFDDETIASSDLWVLTSLLANLDATTWYDRAAILDPEADALSRRRVRDRFASFWPSQHGGSLAEGDVVLESVDPVLAETWQAVKNSVRELSDIKGVPSGLKRLLMARLLQEGAVDLFMGNGQRVLAVLNEVETLVEEVQNGVSDSASSSGAGSNIPGGQIDGHWARNYGARSRNKSDKMDLLRALEVQSGDDLGPIDAAMLATETLTASSDLREAAGYLIERKFAQGPNVALALVDRFHEARRSMDVSQFIQAITGVELPRYNTASWPGEARLALVNHAMDLRLEEAMVIDALSARFAGSLLRESAALGRPGRSGSNAFEAAGEVTSAWQDHVDRERRAVGLPAGWHERRMARIGFSTDPIQQCLSERIATSELIIWLLSALHPSQAEQFEAIAALATRNRNQAEHVLVQLLATESALVDAWSILVSIVLEEHRAGQQGGGA
ncbi:MAG: hypothetical protein MK095_08620 [Phycisphaerales bacterium]|nr:hypothetical protein [Phycisphaerales bacterium]